MRVLLAQNMFFHRTHGGASKSNRILMRDLAARGHECAVVAPVSGELGHTGLEDLVGGLEAGGAELESVSEELVVARLDGVLAHLVVRPSRLPAQARRCLGEFAPDWTLVPSDDPGLMMLGVAHRATPGRVVYLAHTLQQLPFGPRAFYPSEAGTRLVRRSAGVVAVSRTAQSYLRTWGEIDSTLVRPHVYGPGPHPVHHGTAVTMINPCGYKGLPIFLALADALPEVRFLAVPTWGTTPHDLAELALRPNIELAEATDDTDAIWARSRIVVVPSLWDETFGYTAVEPMLRGVPVLASDVGGLGEAKLGVPYLLPVRPIEGYAALGGRPEPRIPEQDPRPWIDAVRALLDDPEHHARIAELSRRKASEFVASLDPADLETYLAGLRPSPPIGAAARPGLPSDRHRLAALVHLLTKEGT
ncbi:glycosyltransferase family 4 protein [Actinocorallia longicatena]|uniref:Glycosyltransferase subfamily 4-like N-terminal domain-containing protein n=1 Tax=Actinocorallia longicatena TaxID=111803 RepID=A0ABP6PXX2_9ACTN